LFGRELFKQDFADPVNFGDNVVMLLSVPHHETAILNIKVPLM
jgi:hypothetical protein